jgi:hypothetical protein
MTAEMLSTIFAGGTFVVIAATAVAALIQLRHLRASTQLNALLTLMKMWNSPDLQEHIGYLRGEFQDSLKDPAFLEQFARVSIARSEHPELLVADFWEQVGAFMKYGLVDEASWLDIAATQVTNAWDQFEPAVKAMRQCAGPASFENFEFAAVRARLWLDRHPQGSWPPGLPRMDRLKLDVDAKTVPQ